MTKVSTENKIDYFADYAITDVKTLTRLYVAPLRIIFNLSFNEMKKVNQEIEQDWAEFNERHPNKPHPYRGRNQ